MIFLPKRFVWFEKVAAPAVPEPKENSPLPIEDMNVPQLEAELKNEKGKTEEAEKELSDLEAPSKELKEWSLSLSPQNKNVLIAALEE